ncbi:MAG: hypothetical protein J0H68_05920 [Sphingobacteriia bacterium]|nr:hypothetical protein [Sphingobacteriia bacterium]
MFKIIQRLTTPILRVKNFIIKRTKPVKILKEFTAANKASDVLHTFTKQQEKDIYTFLKINPLIKIKACFGDVNVLNILKRFTYEEKPLAFVYYEIAVYLANSAHHKLAIELFQQTLKEYPDIMIHSVYLQILQFYEGSTNESLLAAHQEFNKLYTKKYHIKHLTNTPDKNRKIKVGYLCHFFDNSVSRNCLLPMLKAHDINKFEIYCYDDGETGEEVKKIAHKWHDIRGWSDEQVYDLIIKDQIDILQELNGLVLINRFNVLNMRAAPVQMNWYNHASTTGLANVDYVVSDRISITDEDKPYYTEKVYQNDIFIGAVQLEGRFPDHSLTPACIENKYVTFGCFGASHKYSQEALRLWAQVMKRVPNSRIFLKSAPFTYEQYKNSILEVFKDNDIDVSRIYLEGWSEHSEMLKLYDKIDIMLDTFPTTGGTTTFEALWQGIPVVTLRGNRWSSRSGASTLTALGATELIANDKEEYIQKLTELANNYSRIEYYRKNLRDMMRKSPLVDITRFAKDMEKAYIHMWNEWCDSQNHSS